MSQELQGAKCPQCGGEWGYDPTLRMMVCPYCAHAEALPEHGRGDASLPAGTALNAFREVEGMPFSPNEDAALEDAGNTNWGTQVLARSCRSCGAELLFNGSDVSLICPYCGSSNIEALNGCETLAPAAIIPFRINADGINAALRLPLTNNMLVPGAFKKQCTAEKLQRAYIPAWVFNGQAEALFSADYDPGKAAQRGRYRTAFDNVCVLATNRRDLDCINLMAAFRLPDHVPYEPKLISNCLVERYSVSPQAAWRQGLEVLGEQLKGSIEERLCQTLKSSYADVRELHISVSDVRVKLLLLPLWMATVQHKGESYLVTVDGQDGAFHGEFPAMIGRQTWA